MPENLLEWATQKKGTQPLGESIGCVLELLPIVEITSWNRYRRIPLRRPRGLPW
jgi:hypothetical protein